MPEIFNPIKIVEFVYTNKCNLSCSHCISNCGPHKKGKIDLERVLQIIELLPDFKINRIGITGGESLLFFDEIIKVISTAKKHKIKANLISNGFWASNKENTEKIISELSDAGLTFLNISVDKFHSKFVPVQNAFNVFDVIRKRKQIYGCLRFCSTKDSSLLEFIGQNLDYFKGINSKERSFLLFSQEVIPMGRAFDNIPKEKYSYKNHVVKCKCPFLGLPTIEYDGKVLVCCNTFEDNDFKEKTAFELADFNSDSPKTVIKSYRNNLFVFYLRNKGPYFISQLAEKHKLKKVNKPKKLLDGYMGLCDYCLINLSQYSKEEMDNMLLQEFNKDRKMQLLAKKELIKSKTKPKKKKTNKKDFNFWQD